MQQFFPIGELARLTGCRVVTIRYYERIGMLPEPARSTGGHRIYDHGHLDRLTFIRKARELGFPLDAVRSLLVLSERSQAAPCADIDRITATRLQEVRGKIKDLKALEQTLECLLGECGRTTIEDCRVLDALRFEPEATH
ncbi:helix-turn-helix domain-containing protein [Sphingomonas floccifaciens]|uniref:Helix-turn-helix domain-containing protein n=1 Tax=Sphingomonas floccifaciens TaxID=1844115 RepID=A0ABW4NGV9_9SPHN